MRGGTQAVRGGAQDVRRRGQNVRGGAQDARGGAQGFEGCDSLCDVARSPRGSSCRAAPQPWGSLRFRRNVNK